jgi:hypothetical protein
VNAPSLTLRQTYRLLITVIAAPILAVVSVAVQTEADTTVRLLLMVVAALIAGVVIASWFQHILAVYAQIVVLPILVGVYLFELTRTDPIDQMLHVEQLWRLVKARRAAGQPVTIQYSPNNFVEGDRSLALADGTRILPLAGVADLPTIMCREGPRPFAEYVADEHGFNNPRGLWQKSIDLAFIGDSMTYGACLPERDHFIGQIRRQYPAALNLSNGGIGPLFYLAIAREFLPAIRPKYVFYMYDENNDLYFVNVPGRGDLVTEYGHKILRRYLEDENFSQHTIERGQQIRNALRQLTENTIVAALSVRTLEKRITKVLGLSQTRAALRPTRGNPASPLAPPRVQNADTPRPSEGSQPVGSEQRAPASSPDYLEIFKTTFAKTVRVADAAGAKLVFVNIPAQGTVCDGITHPWKKPVLEYVIQRGVDVIDLEKDFRNAMLKHGREQVFAVPPCGGHFSELGYKVIGDRLLQYLEMTDVLQRGAPVTLGEGWNHRRRSDIGERQAAGSGFHSDQLVYAGTDLDESGLSIARRAEAERLRRSRPNIVSRTLMSAADWVAARPATRMTFRYQQTYDADAYVDRVIKTDGSIVIDRDGAAIMGYSWLPKRVSSVLRVRVTVPAWSEAENSIVAALFLDGQPEPLALARGRLRPHHTGAALLDVEIATREGQPVDLSVRVAPGEPGTVYLNSGAKASIRNLSKPTLVIEEFAPFWRRSDK